MDKHKQDVEEYFSRQTEYWRIVYDEKNQHNSMLRLEMNNRKRYVLNLIDKYRNDEQVSILDIGSGSGGIFFDLLGNENIAPVSIDISMQMCRELKDSSLAIRKNGTTCIQADVEYLPFPEKHFDMVICIGVIQYLEKDSTAIREVSRVLKKNGILLITTPNLLRLHNFLDPYYYFSAIKHIKRKLFKSVGSNIENSQTTRFKTNEDFSNRKYFYWQLNKFFRINSLSKLENRAIGYGPISFGRKPIFSYNLNEKLSNFGERLVNGKIILFRPFRIFANRWVYCLRKRVQS